MTELQLSPDGALMQDSVAGWCLARRELPTGETGWVIPMLFGFRLIVGDGMPAGGVSRYWCYPGALGGVHAAFALADWDGVGDPAGYSKNGQTGAAA